MSFTPSSIDAILFDSFTTIVDVRRSTMNILSEYVENPEPIAELWRFRAVDYRMVSTIVAEYETYSETTREALEYALKAHNIALDDREMDEIASVFHELEVFDDVRKTMGQLQDAGYELYILSNGTPKLLDEIVSRARIEDQIEDTISADEIELYKPDKRIYELAARRVGTDLERMVHVATPWYDIYGAMHAGMGTVWVNRNDAPWDEFDGEPDYIIESFEELPVLF